MMASAAVDPHDKMRARDVNKVASGEQAPRPPHETGAVMETPDVEPGALPENILEVGTAPADFRFPTTNQTRHCFTRYIEYHRCIRAKGEGAPECQKFAKYYRSLCPTEWIVAWNEQLAAGTFPGPL